MKKPSRIHRPTTREVTPDQPSPQPESARILIGSIARLAAELSHELEALELGLLCYERQALAGGVNFYAEVREFEIKLIKHALKRMAGSQVRAAVLLSLPPSTLSHKIKQYRIDSV